MKSEPMFDVVEVEISEPHRERVLSSGKTEKNAEAIVAMAVARRGVETHIYTVRPAGQKS